MIVAVPKHRTDDERAPSAAGTDWRSAYRLENESATEAYVDRHPSLMPLLRRAPAAIEEHFGEHRGLRLEASADPESDGAKSARQ